MPTELKKKSVKQRHQAPAAERKRRGILSARAWEDIRQAARLARSEGVKLFLHGVDVSPQDQGRGARRDTPVRPRSAAVRTDMTARDDSEQEPTEPEGPARTPSKKQPKPRDLKRLQEFQEHKVAMLAAAAKWRRIAAAYTAKAKWLRLFRKRRMHARWTEWMISTLEARAQRRDGPSEVHGGAPPSVGPPPPLTMHAYGLTGMGQLESDDEDLQLALELSLQDTHDDCGVKHAVNHPPSAREGGGKTHGGKSSRKSKRARKPARS